MIATIAVLSLLSASLVAAPTDGPTGAPSELPHPCKNPGITSQMHKEGHFRSFPQGPAGAPGGGALAVPVDRK
jgi:hypothetical protein